jgi:hypothetical protein
MTRFNCLAAAVLIAISASSSMSSAEEPKTLLTRFAEWQYPGSKFHGATMGDAMTLNPKGERAVASLQSTAVMTTDDPVAKVLEYYKAKLTPKAAPGNTKPDDKPAADSARSITYYTDSEKRPVAIEMIFVNTDTTSTTLVISRAKEESKTHIAWSQYAKF